MPPERAIPEPRPCPNCGFPSPGRYCPDCGQRQGDRLVSVGHLLRDAIDDQLAINSALPRTLGALFLRPGKLTTEYLAGRIASYIPPVRLYLVASVLFFLGLSLQSIFRPDAFRDNANLEVTGDAAGRVLDVRISPANTLGLQTDTETAPDTVIVWVNLGNDALNQRAVTRLHQLAGDSPEQIGRAIAAAALDRAPAGMFLLLPVFALLLKLLYARRGRYYVEHFVFALHTHAFAYLLLMFGLPFQGTFIDAGVVVWMLVYFFLAMRRVYDGPILGTVVRYLVLAVGYLLLLIITMLGVLIVAILFG